MFDSLIQEDVQSIAGNLKGDQLEDSTILIAGGGGFIGGYFIDTINHLNSEFSKPCKIICMDNFRTGVPERLSHLKSSSHIKLLSQDISKEFSIPGEIDYIIHSASIASPHFYRKFPLETIEVNAIGTLNLLRLAMEKNVQSFLYLSSSEVYGDPPENNIPTKETYLGNVSCTGPRACYDESKRLGETLCVSFYRKHSLPVKVARPFNIYGPGLKIDDKRVIPDFLGSALKNKKIVMFSDGSPTRSFCYITDAVECFFKMLLSDCNGEVFNVGNSNEEISMLGLAEAINKLLGSIEIKREQSNEKDYLSDNPQRRCPDIEKAKKLLGFSPKTDLNTGLSRLITWYKSVYFK